MKHLHFIGICGVGMGALAVLFRKKGWKVTGSDAGFFPPVSTHLEKHGIEFYPGWHPDRVLHGFSEGRKNGDTYLVVAGNVAGSANPEWQYIQKEKLPYVSYPELIARHLVKKNSLVCAGTYGKTSNTALLAWIFKQAGRPSAYMFGGIATDMEESADDSEEAEWSVLEGDEYKTARWDNSPKFSHYSPTHLLLSGLEWDHADIYPTEKEYLDVFRELIMSIPKSGLIVVCTDNKNANNIVPQTGSRSRGISLSNCSIVKYGKKDDADYRYSDVVQTKEGITFTITHLNTKYSILTTSLGSYMAENICGCFAMANEAGLEPDKIIAAIKNFHGLKRRLEKRGAINGADVFDDIAHSPVKAKSALQTLRQIYEGKIYAVFEPNTGAREASTAAAYDYAFAAADEVLIPRLTKIKVPVILNGAKRSEESLSNLPTRQRSFANAQDDSMDGQTLAKIISKTHPMAKYFDRDEDLLKYLKEKTRAGDAVVFLGSHSFRGMIEQLVV